jgi:hypothetical protein
MRLDQNHVQWCRKLFDAMKEGAIWGVPRSAIIFRKCNGSLILQHSPELSIEGPQQEEEFTLTKAHFEAAGISVSEEFVTPDEFKRMCLLLNKAHTQGGWA